MNPVVETGVLIAATIVVGITLILVPVPKQKPPEIDNPPPAVEPPTPQEVVAPTLSITAPLVQPELSDKDRVALIEQKLLRITQQVQQMEKKVK